MRYVTTVVEFKLNDPFGVRATSMPIFIEQTECCRNRVIKSTTIECAANSNTREIDCARARKGVKITNVDGRLI